MPYILHWGNTWSPVATSIGRQVVCSDPCGREIDRNFVVSALRKNYRKLVWLFIFLTSSSIVFAERQYQNEQIFFVLDFSDIVSFWCPCWFSLFWPFFASGGLPSGRAMRRISLSNAHNKSLFVIILVGAYVYIRMYYRVLENSHNIVGDVMFYGLFWQLRPEFWKLLKILSKYHGAQKYSLQYFAVAVPGIKQLIQSVCV